MPFYTSQAQDAAVEALWPTGSPSPLFAATTFEVGLLTSDPRVSGLVEEMPADGSGAARLWGIFVAGALFDFGPLSEPVLFTDYARVSVPNDGSLWTPPSEGLKDSNPVAFAGASITLTVGFNSEVI